ncbi:MAG: HD domain-containing protein [Elusimicrobia bacterium]|nr:HD domain-containing protein [Elusimicrobiota bacterium]
MAGQALDESYLRELRAFGAPARLCARLAAFLRARHPGDQDRIYHCLAHTCEVASLTARSLKGWPRVPGNRKVLLILAAALHDVDPDREPNTPARVDATLHHLTHDKTARALLKDFGARFDFTPEQVLALVMATDFAARPEERRRKIDAFQRAHRKAFGDDPFIPRWGDRLAYWDQIATYLTPIAQARKRVAGLAREFRSAGELKGSMRELSKRFLSGLRRDPLFDYLPPRDRARFDDLLEDLARVRAR